MEFSFTLDQTKATGPEGSYLGLKPPSDSSSSSPDSLDNPLLTMNTLSPGLDPMRQTWDAVDFDLFDSFADCGSLCLSPREQLPSTTSKNGPVPPSKAKRRAQNRASQRAFRERKDRHVKGLEYQLETLNEKHQDLLTSYSKQAEIITLLYKRIKDLQTEIRTIKLTNDPSGGSQSMNYKHTPDCFDAFAFGGNPGSMLFSADGFNLDEVGQGSLDQKPAESESLPLFEDLLR
ncbi:uncharacterized protein PV06_09248 [Exophiala oligosperma]|uniref:BZIP domain-containing protein n=1 Tax=Exophiala oligosperma TaxID=215243 RepID=A0A0D2BLH5_9EURO|nr:uncharacterized protein PV06_09248 [Exophiala oligosperma]KIW38267.1 hypothetical protein PV06_09248 [Exophiala oligosperma]